MKLKPITWKQGQYGYSWSGYISKLRVACVNRSLSGKDNYTLWTIGAHDGGKHSYFDTEDSAKQAAPMRILALMEFLTEKE